MSSAGNLTGTVAVEAANKMFFCHQCNCTVNIFVSPSSDPSCPLCNEGFLEEYEDPNPSPTDSLSLDHLPRMLQMFFGHMASTAETNPTFSGPPVHGRGFHAESFDFDPVVFLRNHLNGLHSSGARVQLVFENHPAGHMPGNFGDYFIGQGLEQLIQQLAENDPNRYGTPPASKSAIDSLPNVKVTDQLLESEMNCAVCMDDFEKGIEVKKMPCKHLFHTDCLLPWLELHNSCPVCRYELPTDDTDYESSRAQTSTQQAQLDSRRQERRFSISLPWPFRRPGMASGSNDDSAASEGDTVEHTRAEPPDELD